MRPIIQLIELVFSIYSLGLVAYIILGWLHNTHTESTRKWLGRFYEPFLVRLRSSVKPIDVGNARLDITPAILLIALIGLRALIVFLLPGG